MWILILFLATLLAGCGPSAAREGSDGSRRIVCLMPSVTKMIVDLGAADDLVGIAEWDAAAPPGLPVVGNFTAVDYERLIALRPTMVITVRSKESPSPRLVRLAEKMGFELAAYANPEGTPADPVGAVADVLWSEGTHGAGPPSVGRLLGLEAEAGRLRETMLAELEGLSAATADKPPARVLLCLSTSPTVMASGSGTTLDALLRYIHAINVAAGATVTAPTYDREALMGLAPDVIVLLSPGASPLSADDERLAVFRGLDIPAVRDGRIALINDPLCLLPSTSLPRIARLLAAAVHGEDALAEGGHEQR